MLSPVFRYGFLGSLLMTPGPPRSLLVAVGVNWNISQPCVGSGAGSPAFWGPAPGCAQLGIQTEMRGQPPPRGCLLLGIRPHKSQPPWLSQSPLHFSKSLRCLFSLGCTRVLEMLPSRKLGLLKAHLVSLF